MTTTTGLRIAYLSGPANAVQFLRELQNGSSDYFGTNYMKQFLLLAQVVDARAHIVTWHDGPTYDQTSGRFRITNRPLPTVAGLKYHFGMLMWHVAVLIELWRFRPEVVVVTGNQDHWWTLAPLRLRGTRFVASYHCVVWPLFAPRRIQNRLFCWLNTRLLLRGMPAIVTTSAAIRGQVEQLVGPYPGELLNHLPTYQPQQFDRIASPPRAVRTPFNIIFAGRLEADKGVFDIVAIAAALKRERPGEFRFDICGDGTQRSALVQAVTAAGLDDMVIVQGYCDPDRMRAIMGDAHVAIVPTRSEFPAGFEMTCAEAILSDRPLVTSAVSPALDYLRSATIEVQPDNVEAYKDAIVLLYDDPVLYLRLRRACEGLKAQFFDDGNSWTMAMTQALALAAPARLKRSASAPAPRRYLPGFRAGSQSKARLRRTAWPDQV